MERGFETIKRIVIKIGTSSLVLPNGKINLARIDRLVFVISNLAGKGKEIVLVSSGVMGSGLNVLGTEERPTDMAQQRAVSGVGQVVMMSLYSRVFSHYRMTIPQILPMHGVIEYSESLADVTSAFEFLLSISIIPTVDENDAVSMGETDHATKPGGNDHLSIVVARIARADLLVMLSNIDSSFDKSPAIYVDAKLHNYVADIIEEIIVSVDGSDSEFSTGGMLSKIKNAQMMFKHHDQMVLINSVSPRDILQVLDGTPIKT